jgi:hypothetical protein
MRHHEAVVGQFETRDHQSPLPTGEAGGGAAGRGRIKHVAGGDDIGYRAWGGDACRTGADEGSVSIALSLALSRRERGLSITRLENDLGELN